MMKRFTLFGALCALVISSGIAQTVAFGKPRITITPAPWIGTPQPANSIFPTVPQRNLFGSDFFPAAPTVLLDNTATTGFYFPEPGIVLDDANIPQSRDTDGDSVYYLTSIDYAFYISTDQAVNLSFYLAGVDPANGGPDPADLSAPIATVSATLSAGAYILTLEFERCSPAEITAAEFTISAGTFDYFWTGMSNGGVCTGGPGMLLASGPDFEDDVFWWEGNQSCGGTAVPGFYFFGGNPRASFYLKVMGAATLEDAIVTNPDVNGDGCVDDADLLAVLFAFGSDDASADVNCDGIVDDADLLEVLFNFGSGC
ncbi:MAG: hypothetical protein SNJ72_11065 [Fimbriimonadales bacterium]